MSGCCRNKESLQIQITGILSFFLCLFVFCLLPRTRSTSGDKVIGAGIHMYVCLWTKKIEPYFSDRLTFSNIRSRTSRRIYRLALPLHAPETLSSLSKSRISIFFVHIFCSYFCVCAIDYAMIIRNVCCILAH